MLRQSIKVKEAKNHINVPGKGAMFNFKMLEDNENEEEEEDLGKAECKSDEMPEVPIKHNDDERHRKIISRASQMCTSYSGRGRKFKEGCGCDQHAEHLHGKIKEQHGVKNKRRQLVIVENEVDMDNAIEEHKKACKQSRVASLTRIAESISPCTNSKIGWKRISLTVDSGACENVIADEEVPNYPVKESRASKMGVKYASATGEEIPNLGEIMLPMYTPGGGKNKMCMQVAEVSRPLASVKRICEAGHTVVFDEEGSYMYNKKTHEINFFREDGGNYMFDVWIPPNDGQDFGRQ